MTEGVEESNFRKNYTPSASLHQKYTRMYEKQFSFCTFFFFFLFSPNCTQSSKGFFFLLFFFVYIKCYISNRTPFADFLYLRSQNIFIFPFFAVFFFSFFTLLLPRGFRIMEYRLDIDLYLIYMKGVYYAGEYTRK